MMLYYTYKEIELNPLGPHFVYFFRKWQGTSVYIPDKCDGDVACNTWNYFIYIMMNYLLACIVYFKKEIPIRKYIYNIVFKGKKKCDIYSTR